MKRAVERTDTVSGLNGIPCGISLGYDRTAEHEWGIKGIQEALGMKEDRGLENFRVHDASALEVRRFSSGKVKGYFCLLTPGTKRQHPDRTEVWNFPTRRGDEVLSASWDESEFMAVAWDKPTAELLEDLYAAAGRGDLVLKLGGQDAGNPFGGAGPVICRTDTDPEYWKKAHEDFCVAQDQQKVDEEEWAKESEGLYDALMRLNRILQPNESLRMSLWFALPLRKPSGEWTETLRLNRTLKYTNRGPLVPANRVWLNPFHQDIFNCGWFTAQELWAWSRGEGPIWRVLALVPAATKNRWSDNSDVMKVDRRYFPLVKTYDAAVAEWEKKNPGIPYKLVRKDEFYKDRVEGHEFVPVFFGRGSMVEELKEV